MPSCNTYIISYALIKIITAKTRSIGMSATNGRVRTLQILSFCLFILFMEGLKEPSHIEGQEGQQEEIPLIQGKEQWLCFAGATVKRYPTSKVREMQVRW